MNLFDVYPLFDITPVKGKGCYVYDDKGHEYLDFYGGHAVISIGHGHPHYTSNINAQANKLGFYSNSVQNPLQKQLAEKLGQLSGYPDYNLFLCNSGAEANENALKLASFHTGKTGVIAFKGAFHGRTSGTLSITDNAKLSAPFNASHDVTFIELNDIDNFKSTIEKGNYCSVIIEGIQGIAGMNEPDNSFLQEIAQHCKQHSVLLILDEIQSGYGRTGKFFAHQHAEIQPDIITIAKGMGNGFPIGGVLINPDIKPIHGQLGTTFGGNHLACAAGIAVLDIIESEELIKNVGMIGQYLRDQLNNIPQIKAVKGKGLMLGIEFAFPIKELRSNMLFEEFVFTGNAANPNMIRLLPPLSIDLTESNLFISKLKNQLSKIENHETVYIS